MGRVSAPSAIGRKRTKYLLAQHAAGATSVRDLLARAYDTGVKDVGQVLAAQSATTTGAELLEQAARVADAEAMRLDTIHADYDRPDTNRSAAWNQAMASRRIAVAIRALSARNLTDGGEK